MNKKNDDNKIQDLRDHIRICSLDIINRSQIIQNKKNDYSIRLKAWSISLFIITAGFCVKEKSSLDFIYYFLPFIPVFLFWFLHSYNEFSIERYRNLAKLNKVKEILGKLYNYSYEDLKKFAESDLYPIFKWKDKGKIKLTRFFVEKIPGIFKKSITSLPGLFFFGGMTITWIIIIIFY